MLCGLTVRSVGFADSIIQIRLGAASSFDVSKQIITNYFISDCGICEGYHVLQCKGKGHPCTGTETLYRPYGP